MRALIYLLLGVFFAALASLLASFGMDVPAAVFVGGAITVYMGALSLARG